MVQIAGHRDHAVCWQPQARTGQLHAASIEWGEQQDVATSPDILGQFRLRVHALAYVGEEVVLEGGNRVILLDLGTRLFTDWTGLVRAENRLGKGVVEVAKWVSGRQVNACLAIRFDSCQLDKPTGTPSVPQRRSKDIRSTSVFTINDGNSKNAYIAKKAGTYL